ncbi:MAG: bacillithiol biosynthesis cysteine-adding enzyme BshC [Ginsengibacter sp.]
MDRLFKSNIVPYPQTGKFSKIVLDYVKQADELNPFYEHPVSLDGIKSAISQRQNFPTNRLLLVEQLRLQYENIPTSNLVNSNIDSLLEENTFTICTAHQPNLFTGHLYFIYKIMHTIKLCESLKEDLPRYKFVPVFFMGSEDADLQELNHVVIDGTRYEWKTNQTGAVGRMKIDQALIQLIDQIAGRLLAENYGKELVTILKNSYKAGSTIEEATFKFVNELFKEFGLIVFLSDKAAFKHEIRNIIEEDIFNHTSSKIVEATSEKLAEDYKAQAYPREINLFYLKDSIRNRIVSVEDGFIVHNTDISFTKESIKEELKNFPERFSPNVILRGLFQEYILPDVAWIGGGGELAYCLQLKDLFGHYKVPYPVLILRNSFLIIENKYKLLLEKLDLDSMSLFQGEMKLMNQLVEKETQLNLKLDAEKGQLKEIYYLIKNLVKKVDTTLIYHTSALETKHLKNLSALEKKIFRAEKRKFEAQQNQLSKIFKNLFPEDGLQERTENFMLFYARFGKEFLNILYANSLALDQMFCVLEEEDSR